MNGLLKNIIMLGVIKCGGGNFKSVVNLLNY